jgi:cytochrome c oxidase accessory protein FixG
MYDQKTLIIAYDADRGEPRGARKKNIDPKSKGLGHCIQCQKCVQVCPTGIDIRDGLQMACIGCAACIDVCDDVMQKMHYPKGLIRYQTGESGTEPQSLLRPRLVTYGVLLITLVLLLSYLLIVRTPLLLDVIRDRNQLYSVTTEEQIKNTYLLKVMNLSQQRKHYQISVSSPIQSIFVGAKKITLLPGEIANLPVSLLIDEDLLKQPKTNIAFKVCEISNEKQCVITESRFIYL